MINKRTVFKTRNATEFSTKLTKIQEVLKVTSILFIGFLSLLGCGDPNLDDPKVREKFIKKAINADVLQVRRTPSGEELPYAPNEESPYTGWLQSNQDSTKVLAHFQHGKPHGIYISWYGTWQKSERGSYKTGNRDGAWTMWHENRQKSSEGTYKDDNREGLWSEWYPDGTGKSNGNYIDGRRDGLWTEWHENRQKKLEETWKNRKQDGLWTVWYESGQKIRTGSYITGGRDGLWTEWHENGQKSSEGTYSEDFRVGDWTWWYESGAKMAEGTFRDGRNLSLVYLHNRFDSLTEFDSVSSEGAWINGIADSKWTFWHDNGRKFTEGNYKSGNGVGDWTWWDRNGRISVEGTFRSGEYDIGATWFGSPARYSSFGGQRRWIESEPDFIACGLAVGAWKAWRYKERTRRYTLEWAVNIDENDHGPIVHSETRNSFGASDKWGSLGENYSWVAKYINRYGVEVTIGKKLE